MASSMAGHSAVPQLKLLIPTPKQDVPSLLNFRDSSDQAVSTVAILTFQEVIAATPLDEPAPRYAAVVTSEEEKRELLDLMNTISATVIFFIGVPPFSEPCKNQKQLTHTFIVCDKTPTIHSIFTAFISRIIGKKNQWEIFAPNFKADVNRRALKDQIINLTLNPDLLSPKFPKYELTFSSPAEFTPLASWTFKNEGKSLLLFLIISGIFTYLFLNRTPRIFGVSKLI